MERFNQTLTDYFNREKHKGRNVIKRSLVYRAYPFAVGVILARTTKVVRFHYGLLTVACRNSIYVTELTQMKTEMIDRINQRIGEKLVRDIRFVIGNNKRIKPKKKRKQLTNEQKEWIEEVVKKAPVCYKEKIRSMLIACKERK